MSYRPGEILLGKYRIEALLGYGAFGEVYRVTHLALNVPRALKILRRDTPGLGSSEFGDFRARFQFEAQLGARLNSPIANPHLLQVYNYEEKGKLLLLEMEYASGGNLAERLAGLKKQAETLPVQAAAQMGMEVAQGLAALHAMDIVHRDLKPSNIMFDQSGHARLADLGLAQVPGGDSLRSQLSSAKSHPGTPAYMSPEQETTRAYLSPASDVYALGLVLFEALTGRMYRGQPPGTHLRELRPDVPGWLDDLLMRMLAEDPKARTWNGQAVAALLQAGVEEETARQKAAVAQQASEQARQKRLRQAEEPKASAIWSQKASPPSASGASLPWWQRWGVWLAAFLVLALLAFWLSGKLGSGKPATAAPATTVPATVVPALRIGSTWTRPADGMVMVYVPEGKFLMGSTDSDLMAHPGEKPQHSVSLDAYWIDQTDVTNAMYAVCVKAGACQPPTQSRSNTHNSYYNNPQYDNYPVVNINWMDANAYCTWAGARLPTEAEWEKAARGTDGRIYPWGNQSPDKSLLNYNGSVGDNTAVGNYPSGASPYGVLDMGGNVWQWVKDWYDANYYASSPSSNPQGPSSGTYRVLRGGSWSLPADGVRSAIRNRSTPTDDDLNVGFRCSRSLP
jgi:eukaryotic-like serine/threonine-protein kinase